MSNTSDQNLTPADEELEGALRRLAPVRDASLDPITMAFEAGARRGQSRERTWRLGTLAASTVALLLAIYPHSVDPHRAPSARSNPSLAAIDARDAAVPVLASDESLLRLRAAIDRGGVDALPRPRASSAKSMSVRSAPPPSL